MLRLVRYFFDTGTNSLLSLACALAWLVVAIGLFGAYLTFMQRGAVVTWGCPPCHTGSGAPAGALTRSRRARVGNKLSPCQSGRSRCPCSRS